jgi:hypothetical protein
MDDLIEALKILRKYDSALSVDSNGDIIVSAPIMQMRYKHRTRLSQLGLEEQEHTYRYRVGAANHGR